MFWLLSKASINFFFYYFWTGWNTSYRRGLSGGKCQLINQIWNCFVLHTNWMGYALYSWIDNGQGSQFLTSLYIIKWLSYIPQQLMNTFVIWKSEDTWGKCCSQWQPSWAYSNIQTAWTTQHWGWITTVWGENRNNRSGCYLLGFGTQADILRKMLQRKVTPFFKRWRSYR